jgi:hypothetical protein
VKPKVAQALRQSSRKGYIRPGPRKILLRDIIYFSYSRIAPFFLRLRLESRYFLIGEAYVYGVIDREIMDYGLPESTFEIWYR